MAGQNQHQLLTELLNITGVKVESYKLHLGIGAILQLSAQQQQATCPRCERKSEKIHQNHWYTVKDLPLSSQPTYLRINRRQFKCETCKKPFSEELEYIKKNRGYTKRLSEELVRQTLRSDIRNVAQRNGVSEEEIQRMLKDVGEEVIQEKPQEIKRLGIDEIAWVKGQKNYCAVLVDLDKRELVGMIKSRTQAEVGKVLNSWGQEVLGQIEEVSIDLWKGYKTLVEELIPQANIVADRFHVIKQVNEELDEKRRAIKNQVKELKDVPEKQRVMEGLKRSQYVLLKNESSLNEKQKEKLEQVKEVAPQLGRMHQVKEELREVFEQSKNWGEGMFRLIDWLKVAGKQFPKSTQTIIRWFTEIVGYFEQRTTQGIVEGINNKLKLIKRAAYGFRNFENFRLRCLLSWQFKA